MQHESSLEQHESERPVPSARKWPGPMMLAYWVGVPLVVAIYAGLNNWEIRHMAGIGGSLTFYTAHAFLPWWTTCACTLGAMQLLQRWKPPWLLILLLGHTLGSFLVVPYSNWLTGLYVGQFPDIVEQHQSTSYFSPEFWAYYARAGVIWFGINFLFDRYLKLPLYRYEVPRGYDTRNNDEEHDAAAWRGRVPAFVQRLPESLPPDEILVVKAEQHYIKVMTPAKNHMVLYRFSDALSELGDISGQQVHRSYWINTNAIKRINTKAKDFYVVMNNDVKVPVSGPYQGMIRELARAPQ